MTFIDWYKLKFGVEPLTEKDYLATADWQSERDALREAYRVAHTEPLPSFEKWSAEYGKEYAVDDEEREMMRKAWEAGMRAGRWCAAEIAESDKFHREYYDDHEDNRDIAEAIRKGGEG